MKKIVISLVSMLFSLEILGAPGRGKPWDVDDSNLGCTNKRKKYVDFLH
jgi:hypothetical protein